MLNLVSLVTGITALIMAAIAFLPFMGWVNWLIVPFAIIGAGLGAMSGSTSGRNLNLIVIAIGVARLFLGGGIF
jgi:hypothetical protein